MTGPKFAVIVPTLNEAAHLPALLGCLIQATDAEIVVSDGGSTDATVAIATSAGAVVVQGSPGRGGQLRRGIARATADWLLLLHADSLLQPDWTLILERHLTTADPHRAYYGRLRFTCRDPRARLVETLSAWRGTLFRLPYGDQGLLIHRGLLDEIGGMPDLALMEDVALARALGRRRLAPFPLIITTDGSAYERDGWLRRSTRNLWRLGRFLAGADAATLAATYDR